MSNVKPKKSQFHSKKEVSRYLLILFRIPLNMCTGPDFLDSKKKQRETSYNETPSALHSNFIFTAYIGQNEFHNH